MSSKEKLPPVHGNAGCLIKKGDQLLVVKTIQMGRWDIPSGKPQKDETADQTAVRETREETGLRVKAIKLLENFAGEFFVYECCVLDALDPHTQTLSVPPEVSHEIAEVTFIPYDTLTEDNTCYPHVLPRIKALFENLP